MVTSEFKGNTTVETGFPLYDGHGNTIAVARARESGEASCQLIDGSQFIVEELKRTESFVERISETHIRKNVNRHPVVATQRRSSSLIHSSKLIQVLRAAA